jgi:hypothetical protein
VDMMKRGATDYVLKERLSRLGPAVTRALQVPAKSAASRRRTVHVRAWRYAVRGVSGCVVPVYVLDTDVPENSEWDRGLTRSLYGGDWYMRLCQKVVLGVRRVQMLRALGHDKIKRFHMNEGHASFLKPRALHFLNVRTGGTICVPMMGQGQPLGLLHLAWTESNTAQDMSDVESRNLAIGLSEIFALTLANVRLREELKDRLFMIR